MIEPAKFRCRVRWTAMDL